MANLKEIRSRILSVKSTRQITNAMKMVAASKLRRAQDAITRLRPYANKLHEILEHISDISDANTQSVYALENKSDKILLILVSSNKGLCGPFNANVVKKTIDLVKNKYAKEHKEGKVHFMAIGRKAAEMIEVKGYKVSESFDELFDELTYNNVKKTATKFMDLFANKEYGKVEIVYNKFKNAAVQILTNEQFLPIKHEEEEQQSIHNDYTFEPSKEYIINNLIPDSLKLHIFKALLDSNAAEQGARMTAMHKATDNATDLIKELTLSYNKARQASITKEILEITAGAEALSA